MMTPTSNAYQVVLTTCPDPAAAERVAQALVEERLAACVNIIPIAKSIYRWKGKVESNPEQLLVIKGTVAAYPRIEARIRALHPDELPEVIAVPIVNGLADYLSWVSDPDATP